MTDETPRKVAIVCRAPASRYLAPLQNESWEIWTCSPEANNPQFTDLPRWDRWYEIHSEDYIADIIEKEAPGHLEWLEKTHQERPADVVLRDRLPLQQWKDDPHWSMYFTSTPAYMIAHAIWEGVDVLGIWGCDMAQDTEYRFQRPCVEYWMGFARGRGIELVIPDECDVGKAGYLYGERQHPIAKKLAARRQELRARVSHGTQTIEEKSHQRSAVVGGKSEVDQILTNCNGELSDSLRELLMKRSQELGAFSNQLDAELNKISMDRNQLIGCQQEEEYLKQILGLTQ